MIKRLCLILLFIPFFAGAQNYPVKPSNYVTDETGTLTQEQQNALNAKLKEFEDTTSNQIFVYVAASLNGRELAQYSEEIFHNWQIGQKNRNNGVLIAIFIDDHKFRVQTGYGLEGALPDLLTKRIQDNDMRPLFKAGDYYEGINTGIDFLAYYSCHEYNPESIKEVNPIETPYAAYWQSWAICYAANIFFLLLYIRNITKKKVNQSKKQRKVEERGYKKQIFIMIAIIIVVLPCVGGIILFFMAAATANLKGFSSSGSYSSYGRSSSSPSWTSSDYSSSTSSDFVGGGGGDSGGGGSSSDW